MPRDGVVSDDSSSQENAAAAAAPSRRRNPRRSGGSATAPTNSAARRQELENEDGTENDPMDIDSDAAVADDDDDEDEESEANIREMVERRRQNGKAAAASAASATADTLTSRRSSSRSARFTGSLKEPPSDSVRDLFQRSGSQTQRAGKSAKSSALKARKSVPEESSDDDDDDDEEEAFDSPPHRSKSTSRRSSSRSARFTGSLKEPPSDSVRDLFQSVSQTERVGNKPVKSPAQRHTKARKSLQEESSDDEEAFASPRRRNKAKQEDDSDDEDDYDEDDGDQGEELKIHRILATRTETQKTWKEICSKMNSSEVNEGSRWFQAEEEEDSTAAPDDLEERFLVKWSDVGYLHVSWETQNDLMDEIEGSKKALTTFFRKADNGILLSADDRKDGDYFDPGYVQIERILDSFYETKAPQSWEEELETTNDTFKICLDRVNSNFEQGTGRQFLVKWEGLPYSDSTYEFERDLILGEVDYKPALKDFFERTRKPKKSEWKALGKAADQALRKAYQLFGDNYKADEEERQASVTQYQTELANHVFLNGGQLRDYQAEGVTWFLSNYVNQRSCIMADEMGLGKTLQTAAFVNLLVTKMHRPGPFLVVVPLSTIAHWQREFMGWTGLNTIVYHGSAQDRSTIRVKEFAYPQDRPDRVGSNTIYLNKCSSHRTHGPWMATVVITTPEIMTADDSTELAAVPWEVLVVDEAHRLKNLNSKLALTLRKDQFSFKHKLLLSGTPIQNDMKEFWTLLNFIDDENFPSMETFLERYGEIKSKDRIDEMHEKIRPYILRRLKEDVEKSVPPKEETLIEVELTLQQKQYYRALYEKNVSFLHKNKKKALDAPSLNNLAMQLRKCCNHLFLLNGIEEELRNQPANKDKSEEELLVQSSGKLVLLDKLLPRLQKDGHRVLIFSQFKIMLDVLEDYLYTKKFKFERIDGSITGHRRQAAIDRFQDPNSSNPPFVMLLSTRAGGVGINLTSADTCIIFDSDWNPQNDLQAQARCHRIGQTKNVKVYRLLSRKSYEMQMFHMSSLKMGLDQAVLKGFESSSSGDAAMTKEEVERLLRHGAYDIFNEEKQGTAEAESNDFIQQDIDSILERRARTVVHDNTGSGSNAAGGTFSKASFVAPKTPSKKGPEEDVDIEDPDFWKKMVGEAKPEAASVLKPRRRNRAIYSEKFYARQLHQAITMDGDGSESSDSESEDEDHSDEEDEDNNEERTKWGGTKPNQWKKSHALNVLEVLERYGYNRWEWEALQSKLSPELNEFSEAEVRRMLWSLVLFAICEQSKEDASAAFKRAEKQAERKKDDKAIGDSLALIGKKDSSPEDFLELQFKKNWNFHCGWARDALHDALEFVRENDPRVSLKDREKKNEDKVAKIFYGSVWGPLEGRGWKEEASETGTVFRFREFKFESPRSVLNKVTTIHPELTKMVEQILKTLEESTEMENANDERLRAQELQLSDTNVGYISMRKILARYAPLQLVSDRRPTKSLPVGRRLLASCSNLAAVRSLIRRSMQMKCNLKEMLTVEARASLPHPLWTTGHDSVLLQAILKHGWVDREKACKAIVKDPRIHWGFPFEKVEDTKAHQLSKAEISNLRQTGERACAFLEDFEEIIESLKGCNRDLIIESYGLRHVNEEGLNGNSRKWEIDLDLLNHVSSNDDKDRSDTIEDLPTKKDMAKRAKYVIQKSLSSLDSNSRGKAKASNTSKQNKQSEHGFATIDQGNRCCILLAEMVKGMARGSHSKAGKQIDLVSAQAYEETVSLSTLFQKKDPELAEELGRIADQIGLARKSMKISAMPGKNLYRIMIGLEPLQPKNASDPLFPSQEYIDKHATTNQNKKEASKSGSGSIGENALSRALKKAHDKSPDGVACDFVPKSKTEFGLQLTMIETMILYVLCCDGVPLSTASISTSDESKHTWTEILTTLQVTLKDLKHNTEKKYYRVHEAKDKLDASSPSYDEVVRKAMASRWDLGMAEEALGDLTSRFGPAEIAKKSLMLFERVRKYALSTGTTGKTSNKTDNMLGSKISSWMGKELKSMAKDYDTLDTASGRPIGYTTADLIEAHPERPVLKTKKVAAYLDKKSARQVFTQAALLTRLRSLVSKEGSAFDEKVQDAILKCKKAGDSWEKQPKWWNDQVHAAKLLMKLDKLGFAKILSDKDGLDEVDVHKPLRQRGLTKQSIQLKANMLVRELHAIEETADALRLLEDRRNRWGSGKKHATDCSPSDRQKKRGIAKGAIQTGLHAFFAAPKGESRKKKIISLEHEEDENDSVPSGHTKRKGSPPSDKEESPSQKKPKKMAPIFRVVPGKRKESDSTKSATTPDKIMRTVVNEDGVIELVSVPK